MIKAPGSLQDLRRNLYIKAKAKPTWRFWGLYVHICKREALREAYEMAKKNNGAPGIDGVTFETIEESGVERFLQQIRNELTSNTYQPMQVRKKEVPKDVLPPASPVSSVMLMRSLPTRSIIEPQGCEWLRRQGPMQAYHRPPLSSEETLDSAGPALGGEAKLISGGSLQHSP